MRKNKLKTLFVAWGLCLASIPSFAQWDMGVHFMQTLHQSNYINPALIPECKMYISIPALSSINVNASNSSFNAHDILRRHDNDSIYILENFVRMVDNKLGKRNYTSVNANIELLSFALRTERFFYSFSINEKVNARLCLPGDMLRMAAYGNGYFAGRTANFDGLSLNATHYREIAFGLAEQYNEKFVGGFRAKALFGLGNVYFSKSDLNIQIEPIMFGHTFNTDMMVNSSIPLGIEMYGFDSVKVDDSLFNMKDYLMNFKNWGIGLDVGAKYDVNSKLSLAASITDIGFIKWNSNAQTFKSNGTYTFDGIDISNFFDQSDSANNARIQTMVDSIVQTFNLDETNDSYLSPIGTRVHLSGFYQLDDKNRFGAYYRSEFYNKKYHPSFSLAYNRRVGTFLNLMANYSMQKHAFANFGLGFSIKGGCYQFYALCDNVYAAFLPHKTRYASVHFGMNLAWGCGKKKVTVPMIGN
ncbi:MAG: DUF5723 family protein [Bacteroidota bacterium]